MNTLILLLYWLFIQWMSYRNRVFSRGNPVFHSCAFAKNWQRANRLWCNTVTGGLHRPLGKWLVPGPQLWQVWPFYLDPDTQTLWSKTGEGFNVNSCILFGRDWRTTQFHLQTNRHETTLPSNSFPVECQETSTRSRHRVQLLRPTHRPCQTLQLF
jgi:hypothetical protein